MAEEKIKIEIFRPVIDGCTIYIFKTSDRIPDNKVRNVESALEDYINRPAYQMHDACVEFETKGATVRVSITDLRNIFNALNIN